MSKLAMAGNVLAENYSTMGVAEKYNFIMTELRDPRYFNDI